MQDIISGQRVKGSKCFAVQRKAGHLVTLGLFLSVILSICEVRLFLTFLETLGYCNSKCVRRTSHTVGSHRHVEAAAALHSCF